MAAIPSITRMGAMPVLLWQMSMGGGFDSISRRGVSAACASATVLLSVGVHDAGILIGSEGSSALVGGRISCSPSSVSVVAPALEVFLTRVPVCGCSGITGLALWGTLLGWCMSVLFLLEGGTNVVSLLWGKVGVATVFW